LRRAQACCHICLAGSGAVALRLAGAALVAAALGGCASGGFSLSKADIDPSILTGSTADATPSTIDADTRQDELTIRNAVSAADIDGLAGSPVPWANSETGSRGAISSLVEERDGGQTCRRFTTSRERFDGVSQYRGEACMVAPGVWAIQSLTAL